MKKAIIIIIVFIPLYLFSQEDYKKRSNETWKRLSDTTFDYLLKRYEIEFKIPEDFKVVKPKKNQDVFYQYAIKHKKENFEIRYYINPFDYFYADTTIKFDPNNFSENFLAVISLNASGNVLPDVPQIDLFPKVGVKQEFNADWGATSAFAPRSGFGKGFEFCSVNSIRKDSVCQIFFFFMFGDAKNQEDLYLKNFHTIRFKPEMKSVIKYHKITKEEEYPGENDFYIKSDNGYLFIRKNNKDISVFEITITDNFGKCHYKNEIKENSIEIDDLAKGQYRLKIKYDTKEINRAIELF